MKLCTHEKAVFFPPVNILTVWCTGFLGCTLLCVLIRFFVAGFLLCMRLSLWGCVIVYY